MSATPRTRPPTAATFGPGVGHTHSMRVMADEMATGRIIREARVAAGLSQEDLARLIGGHQAAISRLEAGAGGPPNMRTLERIADALGFFIDVGGHEIVPGGGHVSAHWWPAVLPDGGRVICPR
jgi:DNA-binding XRE family transcriptional regulator